MTITFNDSSEKYTILKCNTTALAYTYFSVDFQRHRVLCFSTNNGVELLLTAEGDLDSSKELNIS